MVRMWIAFSAFIRSMMAAKRGGFSRTRRPGDQHDSVSQLHDLFQLLRKVQCLKPWNRIRNDAHHDRAASALAENVYSESPDSRNAVRKVSGTILFEPADGMFILAHDVRTTI